MRSCSPHWNLFSYTTDCNRITLSPPGCRYEVSLSTRCWNNNSGRRIFWSNVRITTAPRTAERCALQLALAQNEELGRWRSAAFGSFRQRRSSLTGRKSTFSLVPIKHSSYARPPYKVVSRGSRSLSSRCFICFLVLNIRPAKATKSVSATPTKAPAAANPILIGVGSPWSFSCVIASRADWQRLITPEMHTNVP